MAPNHGSLQAINNDTPKQGSLQAMNNDTPKQSLLTQHLVLNSQTHKKERP